MFVYSITLCDSSAKIPQECSGKLYPGQGPLFVQYGNVTGNVCGLLQRTQGSMLDIHM